MEWEWNYRMQFVLDENGVGMEWECNGNVEGMEWDEVGMKWEYNLNWLGMQFELSEN